VKKYYSIFSHPHIGLWENLGRLCDLVKVQVTWSYFHYQRKRARIDFVLKFMRREQAVVSLFSTYI
jgi:hypothetical protein